MKPDRPYLVVFRSGNRSLHGAWDGADRRFDIILSTFSDHVPDLDKCEGEFFVAGSKWQGLHHFLSESNYPWRDYQAVMFPDDDLLADVSSVNEFFDFFVDDGAALGQMSLAPGSHYTHPITLALPGAHHRYTNFIEVMLPCFRTDFLTEVAWSFGENRSGWGLDSHLWPSLAAQSGGMVISDQHSVRHTRPVGSAGSGVQEGSAPPGVEAQELINKHQLVAEVPRNLRLIPHP